MKNEKSFEESTLSRDFAVMTYLDEERIIKIIQSMSIKHYAYAYHDKDNNEPHYHVLLRLNNPTSAKSIKSKFTKAGKGADNGIDVNSMVQYARDFGDLGEYLTHENQPDKYHYGEDIIVSDDIGYFRGQMRSSTSAPEHEENTAYQILADIEKGTAWREMAKRYGREIIINHKRYTEFLDLIKWEEMPIVYCKNCRHSLTDIETGELYCGVKCVGGNSYLDKPRKCALYKSVHNYEEIIKKKKDEFLKGD